MNTILFTELNGSFKSDLSLIIELRFVSYHENDNILLPMLLYVLQPLGKWHKCLVSRDVISQEYALSSSVEYSSDWFEWFLSCRVPNLHFNNFSIYTNAIWSKLYSNCNLMLLPKLIVHHSLHETWFSNTSVTNNNEFEHMIVFLLNGFVSNMLKW